MKTETELSGKLLSPQQQVTAMMGQAFEFRQAGRVQEAKIELERALTQARNTPYEIEFQTRIQLIMSLADVYQALAEIPEALAMLAEETAFTEKISQIMSATGTPQQKRAATGGHLQVRDRYTQVMLLGKEAPELTVRDWLQGGPANLSQLSGQVVLLEFWATWCKPCQEMFPKLRLLHEEQRDNGLEVIALTRHYLAYGGTAEARQQERELMLGMVNEHKVSFPVGIAEDERLQQTYGANGLPTVVLIDREGIVQYAGPGEGDAIFKSQLQRSLGPS